MLARPMFFALALGVAPITLGTAGDVRAEASDAGTSDASAVAASFDPARPETWTAAAKLGPGSRDREELIAALTAPAKGKNDAALTREEAEKLLDDPRAQLVYGERTVSIVAPSMLKTQRQQHVDLLKKFLQPEHVSRATAFAREHAAQLEQAEKKHGVDREVIVAILMFETRLGTITGDYRAFNSFVSQAYFIDEANAVAHSGERGKEEKKLLAEKKQQERVERIRSRARNNLLALVRMSKARNMDPLDVKGSWAGALGFPQFMPASLRWADDGDGDGKVDLFTFPDSFASVGRYLSEHGFKKDRQKAVWSYNHEAAYVSGVLGFADALAKELRGEQAK